MLHSRQDALFRDLSTLGRHSADTTSSQPNQNGSTTHRRRRKGVPPKSRRRKACLGRCGPCYCLFGPLWSSHGASTVLGLVTLSPLGVLSSLGASPSRRRLSSLLSFLWVVLRGHQPTGFAALHLHWTIVPLFLVFCISLTFNSESSFRSLTHSFLSFSWKVSFRVLSFHFFRVVIEKKRRRRSAVLLFEEEHEKRWFRIWCGFCLPVFASFCQSWDVAYG